MPPRSVTPIVFGLVMRSSDEALTQPLDALAAWMRAEASVELELSPCSSYEALARSAREWDLGWLPPVVYARLAEAVTPVGSILREGKKATYSAALVVAESSPLRALSDLSGVRAGWVDPWSAAGYVVPRIELARAGIEPGAAFTSERFHGGHREVIRALVAGECDVAGTFARSAEGGAPPEGAWSEVEGARVRVLASFGAIPPDVLAVRRNVEPATYDRVLGALREACRDEVARPLVRAIFGGADLHEGIEPGHETLRRAFERAMAHGLFD